MLFTAVLLLLGMVAAGQAETYRWVDANGAVNFSDSYNDIPARYRQQAEVLAEPRSYNVMPGKPLAVKAKPEAEIPVAAAPAKAKGTADVKKAKKAHDAKAVKPRKHRRHEVQQPEIATTPARQEQNRVEEQLRRDRQQLDDAQLPARRAMDRSEEQLRRTRDGISGH
jgi:hypothetical protein